MEWIVNSAKQAEIMQKSFGILLFTALQILSWLSMQVTCLTFRLGE